MRIALQLAAAIGLSLSAAVAVAHDYKAGNLVIDHPWARATPKGATIGGAYMTIANDGDAADRLLGGSTPVAERVEIHEMSMENDVMKMRRLADGIEIPAGGEVAFEPGGLHVMLIGLTSALEEGARVPLTLDFAEAGAVEVELAVEALGAGSGSHEHAQ